MVSGFMALYCASGCMLHELPVGFGSIPARCRSLTIAEDEAGTALQVSPFLQRNLARSFLKHSAGIEGFRFAPFALSS